MPKAVSALHIDQVQIREHGVKDCSAIETGVLRHLLKVAHDLVEVVEHQLHAENAVVGRAEAFHDIKKLVPGRRAIGLRDRSVFPERPRRVIEVDQVLLGPAREAEVGEREAKKGACPSAVSRTSDTT
ncbi:MAG TPA: hypothetical protein VMZ66_01165 [Aeromicrobium sp.]|nr:hypothetical protein [Aeromicrobium sp.]